MMGLKAKRDLWHLIDIATPFCQVHAHIPLFTSVTFSTEWGEDGDVAEEGCFFLDGDIRLTFRLHEKVSWQGLVEAWKKEFPDENMKYFLAALFGKCLPHEPDERPTWDGGYPEEQECEVLPGDTIIPRWEE